METSSCPEVGVQLREEEEVTGKGEGGEWDSLSCNHSLTPRILQSLSPNVSYVEEVQW